MCIVHTAFSLFFMVMMMNCSSNFTTPINIAIKTKATLVVVVIIIIVIVVVIVTEMLLSSNFRCQLTP